MKKKYVYLQIIKDKGGNSTYKKNEKTNLKMSFLICFFFFILPYQKKMTILHEKEKEKEKRYNSKKRCCLDAY